MIESTLELTHYKITFGDVNEALQKVLSRKSYSTVHVIVDDNTHRHCWPLLDQELKQAWHTIEIPHGEIHKTLNTCQLIWSELAKQGADRHSVVVDLGGGVIGDMGGFAASCYMRGIDFVQVPTTLLSMVDASVGGKLGVDYEGRKNFIGQFQDPQEVIIDTRFLSTLPHRELRSGYAEIIKHALIRSASGWDAITAIESWDTHKWQQVVRDSVAIKKDVVTLDPKEHGLRKILNFGHSIGHAIESVSLGTDAPLLHGEAIAIGMVAESWLSTRHAALSTERMDIINQYIKRVYPDLRLQHMNRTEDIMAILRADKKNRQGELRFVLLDDIGDAVYDVVISTQEAIGAISFAHSFLSR